MSRMKKAQAYSIFALVITIPLMLYITYYITATQTTKFGTSEKTLSDQLHEVEDNIEKDFAKAIEISGKRALLAATDHIITSGVYLDDSIMRLRELMENGTIYGNATIVMDGNSLLDWQNKILNVTTVFEISMEYYNFTIHHHDGFNLKMGVNLKINVSDVLGTAKISRDVRDETLVSVVDIEDPIFPLNTNGFIIRVIEASPYPYTALGVASSSIGNGDCSGEVTFNSSTPNSSLILVTNDAAGITGFRGIVAEASSEPITIGCYRVGITGAVNLINTTINQSGYNRLYLDNETNAVWSLPINSILDNGYYINFSGSSGPRLLDRMEGNIDAGTNGFETFINVPDLISAGLSFKQDQVSVAYRYFNTTDITGCPVRGTPDWFRINAEHASKYNITDLMECP